MLSIESIIPSNHLINTTIYFVACKSDNVDKNQTNLKEKLSIIPSIRPLSPFKHSDNAK